MIYLLALIGIVALAVLVWRALGPDADVPETRVVGPDDDPDFLWKMGRDNTGRDRGGSGPDAGTPGPVEK